MAYLQSLLHEILRSMTPLELVAAATSLLCVYLTVRNNIWNWFWGFIGVILYGWIFWQYRNYANTGLQILYFLPIQFYGWRVWLKGNPAQDDALPISVLSNRERVLWTGAMAALTMALYFVLLRTNDPLPFADGLTTAMSIVAQYLQVHKRFENWLIWIAADLIYAFYIFPVQHLYVSMGLYIVFTVLATLGAIQWWRLYRTQREPDLTETPNGDKTGV
ncbi:MAG: nicotinamide riboside transporter PnuC [Capsulimonadales bacterium]|nr:nicotinamide riboside transporter PnuC [Capsulimonadales bacterium]